MPRAPRVPGVPGAVRRPGRPATGDEADLGTLRHLVEQLWAPLHAAGDLRLHLSPDPTPGWDDVERYLAVPSVAAARILFPAGPRPALEGALVNYRGLRPPRTNLQRAVLGRLARAGTPLPFPRVRVQLRAETGEQVRSQLPLRRLAADLGVPRLHAAIGIRTGANRKATLQLVDDEGAPAGFAKFSWDPASRAGVRAETAALVAASGQGEARTPAVLAAGDYAGSPYLVTAPLPLSVVGVRASVPPPTPQELFSLCPASRRGTVASSRQFQALQARVAGLDLGPDLGGLRAALDRVVAQIAAADDEIPLTVRWHGDLTPWNAARDADGVLWVWDWESSEPDTVAGLDALHWHVAVAQERGRPLDGAVLREAAHHALPMLTAAGLPRRSRALVSALYAATLAERACSLSTGAGGWEEGWVLPRHLDDLLRHAHHLMGERHAPSGT